MNIGYDFEVLSIEDPAFSNQYLFSLSMFPHPHVLGQFHQPVWAKLQSIDKLHLVLSIITFTNTIMSCTLVSAYKEKLPLIFIL